MLLFIFSHSKNNLYFGAASTENTNRPNTQKVAVIFWHFSVNLVCEIAIFNTHEIKYLEVTEDHAD